MVVQNYQVRKVLFVSIFSRVNSAINSQQGIAAIKSLIADLNNYSTETYFGEHYWFDIATPTKILRHRGIDQKNL